MIRDDLVQRLREQGQGQEMFGFDGMLDDGDPLLIEAADEIERLRKMNSDLTDKANHYMIRNARIEEENARLLAEISARNDGRAEIQIGKNK